ncbi:MAG TPA: hypothetical protein PL151_15670 [Phycisphaerae bacterium]|nr:hypothetical protein [Phycisphaerae bacterium]HOJ72703.1 hypothetical protein [Phycisphaerae bacterium]HOM53675.1 hypothetical protein [Phycisphaerae bacterium]HON65623.1 hypothetical protein [Phycisphaerae bacterium]HOQ86991.1 hypothetical protein [Phycisphaerae bacterium]
MALTIHFVRPEDFIRVRTDGLLDLEASKQLLRKVGATMAAQEVEYAIVDLRQARGALTVVDLYELVSSLADSGFQPSYHLAILHRPGAHDLAHFFALCAGNRGWQIGAFGTFEEAFDWLNRNQHLDLRGQPLHGT